MASMRLVGLDSGQDDRSFDAVGERCTTSLVNAPATVEVPIRMVGLTCRDRGQQVDLPVAPRRSPRERAPGVGLLVVGQVRHVVGDQAVAVDELDVRRVASSLVGAVAKHRGAQLVGHAGARGAGAEDDEALIGRSGRR